jgi:hypothetical protein
VYQDCAECEELWKRYGIATSAHIQRESRLRLAALQEDHSQIEALTRETERAEKTRRELRESILRHEESHRHGLAAHG